MSGHTGPALRGKRGSRQMPESASDGPAQVVLRIGVAAGKARTAALQDARHRRRRYAPAQQFLSHPLVGDAPVRLWISLRNAQPVQPGTVDFSSRWRGGGEGPPGGLLAPGDQDGVHGLAGLLQQGPRAAGHARLGIAQAHPRRVTMGQAPRRFLIVSTQVTVF